MNNYRLISILNVFLLNYSSMLYILESKSIFLHMGSFIKANLALFTLLATTNLMSIILEKLDRGLFVAGVFINLKKHLIVSITLYCCRKWPRRGIILKIGYKLFRPMDPIANPVKLRQVWCRVVFFPRHCLIFSSIPCLILNSKALFRCMRMNLF
jgi:hypothetical protein